MRLIDADKLIYQSHAQHIQPYINKKDIDNAPTVELAEDCISRDAVLKIYDEWFATCNIADKKESPKAKIKALPTVQPQPKRGKWIKANGEENLAIWTCDQCGCKIYSETEYDRKKFHAWCGKCGCRMDADMREVQDDGI